MHNVVGSLTLELSSISVSPNEEEHSYANIASIFFHFY